MTRAIPLLFLATWLGAQTPPNDNCSNAQILLGPGTVSGTNVGATWENIPGNQCGVSLGHKDVWYSYTPASSCLTTVMACALATNTIISVLSVFTGTCAGLTHVPGSATCVFPGSSSASCPSGAAVMSFGAAGGVTYLIKVRGAVGSEGAFTLMLDCPGPPPWNDTCAGATALSDGTNSGFSNVGAFTDPLPAPCFPMVYDVWFTYTNNSAFTWSVTLDMCPLTPASFDSVIAVYSGTCGALTLHACNGNGCPAPGAGPSRVTFVAAPLTIYTIAVGSYWGSTSSPPASLASPFGLEVTPTTALSIPIGVPCPNPGFPTLTTTLPVVNTTITATLTATYGPGTQAALFVSVPTTVITPFLGCGVYLDLATVGLVYEWTTPGSPYSLSALVPNDPTLEFSQFHLQGVVVGPGQLSNAVALTIGI